MQSRVPVVNKTKYMYVLFIFDASRYEILYKKFIKFMRLCKFVCSKLCRIKFRVKVHSKIVPTILNAIFNMKICIKAGKKFCD